MMNNVVMMDVGVMTVMMMMPQCVVVVPMVVVWTIY
jgi:hypothetical protein